jgi:aminopeptidase N
MNSRRRIAWLVAALCVPAILRAQTGEPAPFSFDSAGGRLPKDVVPLLYRIRIVPDVESHTFSGSEVIQLRIRRPADSLQLNSLNEKLRDVRLDDRPAKNVVSDDARQLTTITLTRRLAPGIHTLRFSYSGRIGEEPRGLFAQSYTSPDGGQGVMLSTQLEATDARRMFPCWDEPAFRARFALSAVVPAKWTAISNMPVASRTVQGPRATVLFQTSPKMPSYLVEFTAGDLAQLSSESGATRLGAWAVRGHEQDGRIALENAKQILGDYNEYFEIPYPLPKLDSIAIPGGFAGAMENWGAITYNAQSLLITSDSSLADRQNVYSMQAHEMAHQWFGDLVTMGWWDDIWLNESFASWLAAKETDRRNPSWKWWESEDASKERAMRADARAASHSIQQHVADEQQALAAFDPAITYDKGEVVLRMLEAFMGPDSFREGIRTYLSARSYSNATTADLWNALGTVSGQDIPAIAADWTSQAGFPLIKVEARCDAGARSIQLSQQRFLLSGPEDRTSTWRVPLQIRTGDAASARSVLLGSNGQSVPAGRCDERLSVNADALGFYRVRYDAATLATNTGQFGSMSDGDRIALLDDQWALVEAGQQPLASYLTLAASMGENLDTRAWQQIERTLGVIEYAERDAPGHEAFTAYARSIAKPVADRLGWDSRPGETPYLQELRRAIISDLGAWGDAGVIAEARRRYEAFLGDHHTLSPDDQKMVLGIVMRTADEATFKQVHELAKSAKDQAEIARYFLALGAVRDPELARQAAQIAVARDELPPGTPLLHLQLLFAVARQYPQLAWSTYADHVDALTTPFASLSGIVLSQYVPVWFWDALPPDQLEAWLRAHVPAEMSGNIERGVQTARFLKSEKQALAPAADAYLESRGAK